MSVNLRDKHIVVTIPYKQAWMLANRGLLTQVANSFDPPISRQCVSNVFRGVRTSARVAEALRRLRAPGFEAAKKAAAA